MVLKRCTCITAWINEVLDQSNGFGSGHALLKSPRTKMIDNYGYLSVIDRRGAQPDRAC